jgi:hypothetical protein
MVDMENIHIACSSLCVESPLRKEVKIYIDCLFLLCIQRPGYRLYKLLKQFTSMGRAACLRISEL